MARPWIFLALALCGCIVEAPGAPAPAPEPRRSEAPSAPAMVVPNGARLGDKIELVSFSIAPGRLMPGQQARAALVWKSLAEVDKDYTVFVHAEDPDHPSFRMNLDHAPSGGRHPTSSWKKDNLVKDEFTFYVPQQEGLKALNVWVGLWDAASDQRLPLTNPAKVRHDGQNRILVAQLPVDGP